MILFIFDFEYLLKCKILSLRLTWEKNTRWWACSARCQRWSVSSAGRGWMRRKWRNTSEWFIRFMAYNWIMNKLRHPHRLTMSLSHQMCQWVKGECVCFRAHFTFLVIKSLNQNGCMIFEALPFLLQCYSSNKNKGLTKKHKDYCKYEENNLY